ncbi:MAG: heme exporter protein CcmD, partial [Geminicoccaceae bacterium]
MAGFGRDGHLGRHQTSLDERQAHPEPQEEGQEQGSDPISGRPVHDRHNMARSDADGKLPESERARNLRPSTAPGCVLDDWAGAGIVAYTARGGAPKEQGLSEFLAMGGYAAYVWPAFGFALVVL